MSELSSMYDNKSKTAPKGVSRQDIYKGKVMRIDDPKRQGRVQVYIDSIYRESEVIPWASPSGGLGALTGSFVIPYVGAFVWVQFEGGDISRPIYSTGPYEYYNHEMQMTIGENFLAGATSPTQAFINSDGEFSTAMNAGEVYGAPDDVFMNNVEGDNTPYVQVLTKTPKGATFKIDERDEKESVSIIDRGGQVIKLFSPVAIPKNNNNVGRRTAKLDGSLRNEEMEKYMLDLENWQKNTWGIVIKNIKDQCIKLIHKVDSMYTSIISGSSFIEATSGQTHMSTGGASVAVIGEAVHITAGGSSIVIDASGISVTGAVNVSDSVIAGGNIEGAKVVGGSLETSGNLISAAVMTNAVNTGAMNEGAASGPGASPASPSVTAGTLVGAPFGVGEDFEFDEREIDMEFAVTPPGEEDHDILFDYTSF